MTTAPASFADMVADPEFGPEFGLVRILPVAELRPTPENNLVYRPVDPADPAIHELAADIADNGVLNPLSVTMDNVIVSGHRRHAAARLAGLADVPCFVYPFFSDSSNFEQLLVSHNLQREKTNEERMREALVKADPERAYRALLEHRAQQSRLPDDGFLNIHGQMRRAAISKAKAPFLAAILRVLEKRQAFLPISDRTIHYALLNDPPLIHASKPGSRYRNDKASYKALCELLTRGRLVGRIPLFAISDTSKPIAVWNVHTTTAPYLTDELGNFLRGYRRDLMQSQPSHIEVFCEKETMHNALEDVVGDYGIPLTTGRGYCSLAPRAHLMRRFKESGKTNLIVLMLSDFDPDGEEIAHSFARSLRDDFGIEDVRAVKVALTHEQVQEYRLPPNLEPKTKSANYKKFVARYGADVAAYELEALEPETLQGLLKDAIEAVIDRETLNRELKAEEEDATFLEAQRRIALAALKTTNATDGGTGR